MGTNLKYVDTDARLDGRSEGKADGFGFDLGAYYALPVSKTGFLRQVNFGLVAYDVGGTSIEFQESSVKEEILRQNIRFGLTLVPKAEISLGFLTLNDPLLAIDIEDRFHLGTEFWLLDRNLGLRGGFQKDFDTDEGATYSFGASVKVPTAAIQLDYAYLIPPTLSATHMFSFSLASSPAPVKLTEVELGTLYSSLYKSYANTPIGSITLRNDYDKELDLTLRISFPGLTESPTEETFRLGAGEKKSTFFPAVFASNILNLTEQETRQAKIEVDYTIRNEKKRVEANKKVRLFGRGAITWDDPGKAAVFVTKLDKAVELFASEATKSLQYRPEIALGNIHKAVALFDAMSAIGINYKPDPENPYSEVLKSQHAVDRVQYPVQLLSGKQGDCDDLTVLYASLLENAGIPTAFLSTRGHITLMFDTGIHQQNWGLLYFGDSLAVIEDETIWIPVEVTQVGNSFARAWQKGSENYRRWKDKSDFEIIRIGDVEGIYLSAVPSDLRNKVPELPVREKLQKMVHADTLWVLKQRSQAIANLAKSATDHLERNRLGIIHAHLDSIENAEGQFTRILNEEPHDISANINLGNIYCMKAEFTSAHERYERVLSVDNSLPGLYLNLAILHQLWSFHADDKQDSIRHQSQSVAYLTQGFELLNGDELLALDMLGISGEDIEIGEKADFKSWIKKQASAIEKFIKESLKEYIFERRVVGTRMERTGVKRGPDYDRRFILWWADAS